jgi:alanine-synthesizing transaminase
MNTAHRFSYNHSMDNLSYAIRGPIFDKAQEIIRQGQEVIQLNIGNPAPFGFDVSDEMIAAMATRLRSAQGYSHHFGVEEAREAVAEYMQQSGIRSAGSEHILLGNGVSELILMTMQALLNKGDEVLVPSPDYPLWTAAVGLAGGKAVHYICDEKSDWNPDVKDIASKITDRTKAIVIINPNNPTGAVYDKAVLQKILNLASRHGLIVLSDEIYDKIVYDGARHYPIASLDHDTLVLTYGGLSKNYMAAGFRAGWVAFSGKISAASDFMENINLLASMRLCANVPGQYVIPAALTGYQHIHDYVAPGGRLHEQMNTAYELLTAIPGIRCVKPKGALYLFPEIDLRQFGLENDEDFAYRLLEEKHILLVPGSGFNAMDNRHFRVVFLPETELLRKAAEGMAALLEDYSVKNLMLEAL